MKQTKLNNHQIKSRFTFDRQKVTRYLKLPNFLKRNPLLIMVILLLLTIGLIALGSYLRNRNHQEPIPEKKMTRVDIYQIGSLPQIKTLAKIEKKNVIQVRAQKAGIVQKIYYKAGDHISSRGKTLVYISDNYQGGLAAGVQRQIAQKQFENTQNTLQLQKDIIHEQRNIANKTDENSDALKEITKKSIDETKSAITLNEEIIAYLDENINLYQATNSGNINRDDIASTKQLKSSYLAALNGLKTNLRNSEYQVDEDHPPSQLSNSQKALTLKQLDLQEKALDLGLEISKLQVQLAQISTSLAYPVSFSNGDVERVHVRVGQQVNPGDILLTISGCDKAATAIAFVPQQTARNLSRFEAATLYLSNGKNLKVTPDFISHEATNGTSFSVQFSLPEDFYDQVADGEYLQVSLPVGLPQTTSVMPFVPLDSVYQSTNGAYIFVVEAGKAKVKQVELGEVYGQYIQVQSGLSANDQVILDRTVIEGDLVESKS